MYDFSVIGDACFAHRIMGLPYRCFSVKKKCVWAKNAAFCCDFMRSVGD